MREKGLAATIRTGRPRGPRNHDGTIIPEAIDTRWETDMTATITVEHGQGAVFIAVDHCSAESFRLRLALIDFRRTYNECWLIERHGHRSPTQFRRDQMDKLPLAA